MRVIRSWAPAPVPPKGCVLTVGNFDGLHLGHRKILRRLLLEAGARRLPALALTFTPHPEKLFGPRPVHMIQTLDQRLSGLAEFGLEAAVVAPFTRTLSTMDPAGFARTVLAGALRARLVVVGSGFRFGRGREGGVRSLSHLGKALGFEVVSVPPLVRGGRAVSSSRIRVDLARGAVERAAALLGRPYEIEGDIVRGRRLGHCLGIPTANLKTPNEIVPPGVFATRIILDGRSEDAVTNVGVRPTFGSPGPAIETHLLDFSGDLYGRTARLLFIARIRAERRFPDPGALAARLRKDIAAARRLLDGLCP